MDLGAKVLFIPAASMPIGDWSNREFVQACLGIATVILPMPIPTYDDQVWNLGQPGTHAFAFGGKGGVRVIVTFVITVWANDGRG